MWSNASIRSAEERSVNGNGVTIQSRIREAVRSNDILCKAKRSAEEKLIAGAKFHTLERGAVICNQDTPAVRFWLVTAGEVKLVRYTSRGDVLLIELVRAEELFGLALHGREPTYACGAVVLKGVELISFRARDLLAELESNPALQRMLLAEMSYRLSRAQRWQGLGLEEVSVRIAHALLLLERKFGPRIPQTRATLAEISGTSVETAIRVTNAMTRRGILAIGRARIEIRSLNSLQVCAQGNDAL
jgi:CRP-like cAMP-binding protein